MQKYFMVLVAFIIFTGTSLAKPVPYTPFDLAVINSNKPKIAKLLRSGYDINTLTLNGKTPLMYAASVRNISMLKFLIKKGADIRKLNNIGYTALMYAVGMSDEGIEKYTTAAIKYHMAVILISQGARASARDTFVKQTVLHHALRGKTSLQLVRLLVQKNASIKAATPDGKTILMYAAATLNPEIIQYLIQNGATVNQKDTNGDTALMHTVDNLNNLSLNIVYDAKKFSPYLKTCDVLLKKGADIHIINNKGEYVFHRMVRIDAPMVKYLVQKGARVNQKDRKGTTILKRVESAYRDGNLKQKYYLKLKQFLIHNGAAKVSMDSSKTKSLFGAISSGNLKRVRALITQGADVNGFDSIGNTPLLAAIKQMNYPIARYLISKGANVNGKTQNGTPILMAIQGRDYTVRNNYRTIKYYTLVLNSGADVNGRDTEGRTSAMYASKNKDMEVLKLLGAKNADMRLQDNKGDSVLHYGIKNLYSAENLKMITYLISRGVSVNIKNKKGQTPLAASIGTYHIEIVKFFLKKGANPNIKDAEGLTAIGYAGKLMQRYKFQSKYYSNVIALLKKNGGK